MSVTARHERPSTPVGAVVSAPVPDGATLGVNIDADPRFTIAVPASTSETDLAATLQSLRESAARAGYAYELVIAINGPEDASPALDGARAFANAAGLTLDVATMDARKAAPVSTTPASAAATSVSAASSVPPVRVIRVEPRSKVAAWNAIRSAARGPLIVFADADVRVDRDAIPLLVGRLEADPRLAAVAGREVAVLEPGDGLVARVGALPYRFDFANIPGRLYAIRAAAVDASMPADVVAEDAYLTVQLGRDRFTKEPDARVYLRPPTTWRDYLVQRVRHEVGKIQLDTQFADLRRAHGFGRTPWRAFLRDLRVAEYPLVAVALAVRLVSRRRARRVVRDGFRAGWQALPTTKQWRREPGAR